VVQGGGVGGDGAQKEEWESEPAMPFVLSYLLFPSMYLFFFS
jgi:hypothetical protein